MSELISFSALVTGVGIVVGGLGGEVVVTFALVRLLITLTRVGKVG